MKHYSTRETAQILDTTEAEVRNYARLGRIEAQRGEGGTLEFTFQQLLLLKTTKNLLDAGVTPKRMRTLWASLRTQLPDDIPLTSVTVFAEGDRAVASDGAARWQPESGQFLLDLDASAGARTEPAAVTESVEEESTEEEAMAATRGGTRGPAAQVRATRTFPKPLVLRGGATATEPPAPPVEGATAEQWFRIGCATEEDHPLEARAAYLLALDLDSDHAAAHLNLGRMLHEAGEHGKAEVHYREAVRCSPEDATSHFNLGVLLEDLGRREDAMHAYRQAIARDPEAADAHYNLGLLIDRMGRRAEALKHLMTARRLYAEGGGAPPESEE